MSERLVVIGDIHGDARRLDALLERIELEDRRLVFLGDYVNRGAETRRVLDIACRLKATLGERVVFLAGNHELALQRYLDDSNFVRFAAYGGIPTIRSYVGSPVGDVAGALRALLPREHRMFLDTLEVSFENDDVLISHTGFDPERPHDRSPTTMVELSHPEMFARDLDRPVVCGHYVQRRGTPVLSRHLMCIDTGCGTVGGPLTALFLPERSYIQA